jgi:hypothetical protein
MGHKSGSKLVGARGKMSAMSMQEAEDALDGDMVDVKALASEHVVASIETLARAQRTELPPGAKKKGETLAPWATRTKAARDLIEIHAGRPETRETVQKSGGLTVNIIKFSTGEMISLPIAEMKTIEDVEDVLVDAIPED